MFFELLQVALGNRTSLSSAPTAEEWERLYQMSNEQALTGISFSGIERLPKAQQPPLSLACTWQDDTLNIEKDNLQHHKRAAQLLNHLHRDGFRAMILKGVSNAPNYPESLRNRRTPGDIDVWLWPSAPTSNPIKETIDYCLKLTPNQFVCYIHVEFPVFSDIPVEAHFRPSFLCNPIYNRRLQRWFDQQRIVLDPVAKGLTDEIQTDGNYYRFNAIFQLLHIYKHLFEEGIGLRQILDYYLLLKKEKFQIVENQEFIRLLNHLGLTQFFNALLWVMHEVFESNDDYDDIEEQGKFLLSEILQGGNFGQYDKRIKHGGGATIHAWEKLKHNLRLFSHYPSEVLWEPVFRIYHFFWRSAHKA